MPPSRVTTALPHGILFVLDPTHRKILVPQYDDNAVCSRNPTCISIAARAEVDGEVVVRFSEGPPPDGGTWIEVLREYPLETPGRRLAVVTSEMVTLCESQVNQQVTPVSIFVNPLESPDEIWIEMTDSAGHQASDGQNR